MDYSLLIAIEDINPNNEPLTKSSGINTALNFKIMDMIQSRTSLAVKITDGTLTNEQFDKKFDKIHRFIGLSNKKIYHISIIDYLQEWNCNKISERFIKTTILGKNK